MAEHQLKAQSTRSLVWCVAMVWICAAGVVRAEGLDLVPEQAGLFDDQTADHDDPSDQEIKVGSFGQVDLHVKDLEIAQVLQLLSLQSQRNIIASRNVAGSISADLYGVDFYEALDAILHTNGFGYQEKGNLIFVYTATELQSIEEAQRKITHRIVRLNYIPAADASAFVTPLLSPAGSVSVSGDVSAGFQPSIGDGGANSFAHTDTLIIYDYAENVDEIVNVLQELDKRPQQVLVEATILQARLSEDTSFGVDLSVLTDFAINKFLDPIGIIEDVFTNGPNPQVSSARGQYKAFETTVGNTRAGDSGVRIGVVTDTVAAFIRALDSVTDTTVIANPKLLVLNRQKADLLVGEKLGYLSSTATDTSTTQTVEFLEIGTQLTLRPFVSDDGFIRLELRPSVSDGNTNRTVGSFVVPETTNQEVTTNVVVHNGQTVVLGGLFKEDTEVSRRQVPGLGDIPVLGVMFKGQDDKVARNEVIFLITPTIMKDKALGDMGDRVAGGIESARLGGREGLLPWSRTKLITAHIRDAQQLYDQGEFEKALWTVNMALALNPQAIEGIRLKEKLTGQQAYVSTNLSILNEAVDQVIHGAIGPALPEDTGSVTPPDDSAPSDLEPSGQILSPDESADQSALSSQDDSSTESENDQSDVTTDTHDTVWNGSQAGSEPPYDAGITAPAQSEARPWLENFFDVKKLPQDPRGGVRPVQAVTVRQPDSEPDVAADAGSLPSFTPADQDTQVDNGVERDTDEFGFEDDDGFTDMIDEDIDSQDKWFDVVESDESDPQGDQITPQINGSDARSPAADTIDLEDQSADAIPAIDNALEDDVEFDMDDHVFDDDPDFITTMDDLSSRRDEVVTPEIDDEFSDDLGFGLDEHGLEDDPAWEDESSWSEPDFEEGQLDIEHDLNGDTAEENERFRFPSDRVPSTDPFNAVVEWLPSSERREQNGGE